MIFNRIFPLRIFFLSLYQFSYFFYFSNISIRNLCNFLILFWDLKFFRIFGNFFLFFTFSHYSKSQIFVQKFNFDKTPNIFTSFSAKLFWTIFLVKSKLSTARKPKTTTFSRVFHPKKSTIV